MYPSFVHFWCRDSLPSRQRSYRVPVDSPFAPGSPPMLPRRTTGLGTPVWRLMENLRPLNAILSSCCENVAFGEAEGVFRDNQSGSGNAVKGRRRKSWRSTSTRNWTGLGELDVLVCGSLEHYKGSKATD